MNMYTLESLKEINNRFCRSHEMTEYDVEKANEYVELIENSRSKLESKIGDMIQYTNEYGEYFEKLILTKYMKMENCIYVSAHMFHLSE